MSTWRRKAIACMPYCRREFESPGTTICDVFIELRAATVQAHINNDTAQLKLLYDFAEWCLYLMIRDLPDNQLNAEVISMLDMNYGFRPASLLKNSKSTR